MQLTTRLGWRLAQEIYDRLIPPKAAKPVIPAWAREWATDNRQPTLSDPVSQLCTHNQFSEPEFARWCAEMKQDFLTHRKFWEFAFILQVLDREGMLRPGRKGLGFGTGREPLPAVMAQRGVEVLATDLDTRKAAALGWVKGKQHASALEDLNRLGICDPDAFRQRVRFAFSDMNAIPAEYRDFDFCWSACALEHLGSLDAGLAFVENSLRCLRPGGVAIHTTEYNCLSDDRTVKRGSTVVYRMQDFVRLGERLRERGHRIEFNFHQGDGEVDRHVDVPPYAQEPHLKLRLMRYVCTSIGLIVHVR